MKNRVKDISVRDTSYRFSVKGWFCLVNDTRYTIKGIGYLSFCLPKNRFFGLFAGIMEAMASAASMDRSASMRLAPFSMMER